MNFLAFYYRIEVEAKFNATLYQFILGFPLGLENLEKWGDYIPLRVLYDCIECVCSTFNRVSFKTIAFICKLEDVTSLPISTPHCSDIFQIKATI